MKLTDEQILAAIDAAEATALGPKSSEIASDRADALDRYMGKAYGDEQAGRSQVVSRDISDVVEGVTANVLKPFVGGDRVVMFNPRGPEDEEGAQQETDYINFVVMERNNGFVILNSGIKDALLLRNGYLKCAWTKRDDITIETYQQLSDEELTLLAQDEAVEIIEHSEYPDPFAQGAAQQIGQMPMQPPPGMPAMPMMPGNGPVVPEQMPMLHDVKVHRKQPTEYVEIMPAPPDEILVSRRSTEPSLQNVDFVQHRTHKTLSEIRELGYKVDDDIVDDEDGSETIEDMARAVFNSNADVWNDPTQDLARRLVLFKESWMRIDANGDGIAELRKICQVGTNLLANEDADLIPLACFTPVLMPHRHLGVSVYDLVKDIALIKTAMLRSHLDNRYLINNAEKVVNVDVIENMDDWMVSRPGGIKRVRGTPGDAAMPLVVPDTGAGALQTLEYLDSIRENRTGYTRTAEGMKSGSLATETLGELQMQQSQSGIRLEMIARTIAETGLRDLFRIVHALTLKHSSRAEKVRLRNKWVSINPREWVRRTDLSITVGLGSTTGPQQMQNLMMIGQAQQQAMPLGIVTPENVYNTLSKLATAAGFKNPDEFFKRPEQVPKKGPDGQPVMGQDGQPEMESAPPPQQKDPLVQAAEIKAQSDGQALQAKSQFDMQSKQMDMHGEQQKMQADQQREAAQAQADMAVEQQKAELQVQLRREELAAEYAFKREEMALEYQYKMAEKRMEIDAQKEIAQMNAQVTLSAKGGKLNGTAVQDTNEVLAGAVQGFSEAIAQLGSQLKQPKTVLRGPDGRVTGIQ